VIGRAVAITIWVATALLDAVMVWVLTAGGFLDQMATGQPTVTDTMFVVTYAAIAAIVAVTLSYATVGVLLAMRSGAGRIGSVLLAGGLSFAAIPFGYVVGGSLVRLDPFDPLANAVLLIGPATIAAGYSLILPVLALVFPHGSLPSARWRWPVRAVAAILAAATAITVLNPGEIAGTTPSRNPFGLGILPPALGDLAGVLAGVGIVGVTLIGTAAVVVRYRRGSFVERQQLRWFVAAVLLAGVPIAISPQPGIGGPVWVLIAAFGLLLVPVAVWIAVTRHRLYEIDRILSRTVSYAVVTGILAVVFVSTILVSQTVLASFFSGNSVAVAASTLVVAALFQPLRRRVQSVVDRRFNRARYDAERTVAAFGAGLRDEVDLGALRHDLVATIDEALQPTCTGVWLRDRAEVGR
jgi:hypothetical protein